MATKTISIEIDAYELLVRERKDPKESFSRVIRRVLSERPALTSFLIEFEDELAHRKMGPACEVLAAHRRETAAISIMALGEFAGRLFRSARTS